MLGETQNKKQLCSLGTCEAWVWWEYPGPCRAIADVPLGSGPSVVRRWIHPVQIHGGLSVLPEIPFRLSSFACVEIIPCLSSAGNAVIFFCAPSPATCRCARVASQLRQLCTAHRTSDANLDVESIVLVVFFALCLSHHVSFHSLPHTARL